MMIRFYSYDDSHIKLFIREKDSCVSTKTFIARRKGVEPLNFVIGVAFVKSSKIVFKVLDDRESILAVKDSLISANVVGYKFIFKDKRVPIDSSDLVFSDLRGGNSLDVLPSSFDTGIFKGYLEKRSRKNLKEWKKRWFVLTEGTLYYTKNKHTQEMSEVKSISLNGSEVSLTDLNEGLHCFDLNAATRLYQLKAQHEDENASWIQMLEKQIILSQENGPLHLGEYMLSDQEIADTKKDQEIIIMLTSSLQGLLTNSFGTESLLAFMFSEGSHPYLMLYLDLCVLLSYSSSENDHAFFAFKLIISFYLDERNRKYEISISEKEIVIELFEALNKVRREGIDMSNSSLPLEALRQLQSKILLFIQEGAYLRFCKSSHYKKSISLSLLYKRNKRHRHSSIDGSSEDDAPVYLFCAVNGGEYIKLKVLSEKFPNLLLFQ